MFRQKKENTFQLQVSTHSEGIGSVTLDWSSYKYTDKVFKI